MNIAERLDKILKEKNLNPRKVSYLANGKISAEWIYKVLTGAITNVGTETAVILADVLGVSAPYLLFGDSASEFGKHFYKENVESKKQRNKNDDTLIPIKLSKVPLIVGSVTAGAFNVDISSWDGEWVYVDHATKNMLGWKIKGRSMEPDYLDGDIVIIDKSMPWKDGNDVIARRNGDEVTIKRVTVLPEGGIELRPLNQKYPTLMFSEEEEIELGGVVVKLVRDQLKKKK